MVYDWDGRRTRGLTILWWMVMLVTPLLVVLFVAVNAYAGSPSFNCKKAKKADEKAICGSDLLSDYDQETTRIFLDLKSRNRTEALRIARSFLAQRKACGVNKKCIEASQVEAIRAFNAALAGETNPAVQQPQAQNVDASNPWPDAFSRRDYKLGITINQFLSMPYPDSRGVVVYPVCSNDQRVAQDTRYYAVQVYSETFRAAGIVQCKHFWNSPITPTYFSVVEAGLGLADEQVLTSFYFMPDVAGKLRLFWIVTEGPSSMFGGLIPIMQKGYGPPSNQRVEIWQNKIGNTFNNQVYGWANSSSEIEIRNFADEVTRFRLEHRLSALWAQFSKFVDQKNTDAAKRL